MTKPMIGYERKPKLGHELDPSTMPIERIAVSILSQDVVRERTRQLSDRVSHLVQGQRFTTVTLGDCANSFSHDFIKQKPFRSVVSNRVILRASAYNGTTQKDLSHDADQYPGLDAKFQDSKFTILIDEVRHTGKTMFALKDYFETRYPYAKVITVCLVDRPDCLDPSCSVMELDYVGFNVVQPPNPRHNDPSSPSQGWLLGYGMGIDGRYDKSASIWWTMVKPCYRNDWGYDEFYKPFKDERPIITVPMYQNAPSIPLDDWKLDYKVH